MNKESQRSTSGAGKLLYTFSEAAELLSFHHRTLRLFAKRGELETIRFGRAIRIPRDALERFVDNRRSEDPDQGPAVERGRSLEQLAE